MPLVGAFPPTANCRSRPWFRRSDGHDIISRKHGRNPMRRGRWAYSIVFAIFAFLAACLPGPSPAAEMAVSQYGRVTATLPWAVAMEKGLFAAEGVKVDHIISGEGGGTTLRNMLASDLPYGEVATSAALAAIRSGLDIVIVNTASDHIGEISLVANPKSSIHKVQDLAGRKAGFTGPKSTSEMLLRLALEQA